MRRKHLSKPLLTVLLLLVCLSARAYDFETDGIYYNILSEEEQTCAVTARYYSSYWNKDAYEGEVVIPATTTYLGKTYSVVAIGDWAFFICSRLTAITIPDAVTSIGDCAFNNCTSLAEVTIGSSATSIGEYAFDSCSSLTEITIPDAVTSIGNGAFFGCSSLAEVTIGSSVTSIGNQAFQSCSGLKSMTSLSTTPPICTSGTFYNAATSSCVLYVPLGTTSAYSTAKGWKDFFNIEEIDVSGVDAVAATAEPAIVGYYSLDGKALSGPQQGITIVRYADGTTRTVLAK